MSETCAQCGRVGTRAFKTLPAVYVDWRPCGVEPFWTDPITICAAVAACRRRWPRRLEETA